MATAGGLAPIFGLSGEKSMQLTDAKWVWGSRSPVCSSLAVVILEDTTAALSGSC